MQQNIIIRPALVTLALVSLPLLAMQFTAEVQWTLSDFIIMGAMLFIAGVLIELALSKLGKYKLLAAVGVVFMFVWLWAELAVGVFTTWGS